VKIRSLFFAALSLLGGREARAYVCTAVQDARPALSQAWNQRCIPYFISRAGTLLGGEERRQLIANSFDQWDVSMNSCTDMTFLDAGYTDDLSGFDAKKPDDQKNVIASIEDPSQLGLFPSDNLLAITLTSFSVETGEIFDADILINAVNNNFQDVPSGCPNGRPFDLRNTLVHEIGHFLGFDHERVADSTMFASAEPCEVKKRDLTADDRLGLCTVYGAGEPTMTCAPPSDYDAAQGKPERFRDQCERLNDDGGCNCATPKSDDQASTAIALSLLAVGSVVLLNRRGR
jgi:hypothetical protein